MLKDTGLCGKYKHYKNGNLYEVVGHALHTETREDLVVYKALYHCDNYDQDQLWVRPKQMFLESVMHDGQMMPRFQRIE